MPTTVEMMPYVWIGFFVISTIIEIVTVPTVIVWTMPANIIAFVLSLLGVQVWIQVLVFFVISILSVILFKGSVKNNYERTNVDRNIGKNVIVLEEIDNLRNRGLVKVNAIVWNARSEDSSRIFAEGEIVEIVRIEGVTLICK